MFSKKNRFLAVKYFLSESEIAQKNQTTQEFEEDLADAAGITQVMPADGFGSGSDLLDVYYNDDEFISGFEMLSLSNKKTEIDESKNFSFIQYSDGLSNVRKQISNSWEVISKADFHQETASLEEDLYLRSDLEPNGYEFFVKYRTQYPEAIIGSEDNMDFKITQNLSIEIYDLKNARNTSIIISPNGQIESIKSDVISDAEKDKILFEKSSLEYIVDGKIDLHKRINYQGKRENSILNIEGIEFQKNNFEKDNKNSSSKSF